MEQKEPANDCVVWSRIDTATFKALKERADKEERKVGVMIRLLLRHALRGRIKKQAENDPARG